jgi:hypothetical protein
MLLSACLFSAVVLQAQTPTSTQYPGYDVRYGIPPDTDLAALVDKPALVTMTATTYKDSVTGETRLNGFGEAHGIYDVPIKAVVDVLFDYPGQRAYTKSLLEVKVLEQGPRRVVVYQDIGVQFLGIKIGSKVTSEILLEALQDGAFGIRARMVDNPSNNMFESYSSWYVKEVVVEGRRLLYLHNFTRPGMRNPVIGTMAAIKGFTPGELKGQIDNTVKEARRRLGIVK